MTKAAVELARVRELVRSGEARELRIGNGLSLAEVAKDIGVHPSAVYHWEQGVSLPRGPHALRYARLLEELRKVGR